MSFCGNCGASLEEGKKFCGACGTPVDDEPIVETEPAAEAENQPEEPVFEPAAEVVDEPAEEAEATGTYSAQDIEQNKVMAALANVPFLFWLPLVTCKDSKFAKDNANQGLVYLIGYVANWLIFSLIVPAILALVIRLLISVDFLVGLLTVISVLVSIISWVIGLVLFAAVVVSFIFAITATGTEAKEIPVIGKLLKKVKIIK